MSDEQARGRGRPAKERSRRMNILIGGEADDALKEIIARQGGTATEAIERALSGYARAIRYQPESQEKKM